MEERERQLIYVVKDRPNTMVEWWVNNRFFRSALSQAAYNANERYVDRLTKKQREAINFIRMLPEGEYVEGVGAWMNDVLRIRKVYIIDC
jgi:hypothetical protein